MKDNLIQKTYKIIIVLLPLIFLISTITTVFIISNNIANGIVSSKYFWFYLSIVFISISCIIIKKKITFFCVIDSFIILSIFDLFLFNRYSNYDIITTKYILLILIIILYFYFKSVFQTNKNAIFWTKICFIITGLVESIWGLRQLYGFEQSLHSIF